MTAARSGVPTAYEAMNVNGSPYALTAMEASGVTAESLEASLLGRTCVQMAPEMALPKAPPTE